MTSSGHPSTETTNQSKVDALLDSKPGVWKDWKPHDLHELVALARQLERELVEAKEYILMMREAREEHLTRCQGENKL